MVVAWKTPPRIGSSHERVRIEKMCDENEDDSLTDMFNDAEDYFVDCPDELTNLASYTCNLQSSSLVMHEAKIHNANIIDLGF